MAPRNPIKRDIDDLSSDCSSDSFRKSSKIKRTHSLDKDSDEYKKRRERNNLAVKKSRSKTKLKTQQTVERVNQLREENEMLEAKIKILTKELSFLKDLFLAHAGSAHGQNLTDAELSYLKSEVDLKTVNGNVNHSA
ncbi:unnamed protein product [Larinioides sclopetarius]|uniref:BZIP domain-containing protein n=1 Tax=Larinioides sclopetarius TaxID=280406 RepID=A0AAV1ZZB8_9ARAC